MTFSKVRVWLDDVRPMPAHFNVHVRTAHEAIALLSTGMVGEMSLDNDLGDGKQEGCAVAAAIEEAAFQGSWPELRVEVHTDNPAARARMIAALRNAKKYWERAQPHEGVPRPLGLHQREEGRPCVE